MTTDTARAAALAAAADRLIDARESGTPCAPLRDLVPGADIDDGYAVQQLVQAQTSDGRRRVGRKIGLTSEAVQRQMGVDTPDFGVLFDDMGYADGEAIAHGPLLQPRIEAEVAVVLAQDLPARNVTVAEVRHAVDFIVPAIEVCESRIRDWDITLFDTVADNASSGVFVMGTTRHALDDIDDLAASQMTMTCGDEVVSAGTGAACMGHPVNAVQWLANAVAARGEPLQAGEVILSGSLGPLVPAAADATYEAVISGLGSVRAVFTSTDTDARP